MNLRVFLFVLCDLLAAVPGYVCAQESGDVPLETTATNAILVDARSGDVLFEKDADRAIPPASMSKLVTQAVVFDLLKSGELKEDQEFVVSEDAWRRGGGPSGGSTMYANLNSKVKVIDLLRGAIIQSANDACITLADGIAGSEATFTDRMAKKAKALGMTNSRFANATGLPDPGQLMSVRDLSKIAQYIIHEHPDRYAIYGEAQFSWNGITQQNRNPLLKDYPGADGMKTGFTKEAGYGLVGSAERDGRRLIMVIAGLKSIAERKAEAQKILDWGFKQFKPIDVYDANETVGRARVWGGEQNWVDLVVPDVVTIALSRKEQNTVEVNLAYNGPLMAPVSQGTKVGSVRIVVNGRVIGEYPVMTGASVPAIDSMWRKALDSMMIMVFGG